MNQTLEQIVDQSIAAYTEAGLLYPVRFQQMRQSYGTKAALMRLVMSSAEPKKNPLRMMELGLEHHTVEAIVVNHPEFNAEPAARAAAKWRLDELRKAKK